MERRQDTPEPIRSIPALAAAIRETHSRAWPTSTADVLRKERLQPLYHIQAKSEEAEARAAAHLVSEIAERLRRLGSAYGEWDPFDPSAFFDLTAAQTGQLVHVVERVSTVYIAFFVDPLLPSFQRAEAFWANRFFPAYHSANPAANISSADLAPENGSTPNGYHKNGIPTKEGEDSAFAHDFADTIHPAMLERWSSLLRVGQQTRRILADHIGYLAVNGSQEERSRWRAAWSKASPIVDGDTALFSNYQNLPTLTLSIEFPLPVYRQPGRQQRLRLNRQRRRSDRH